jgi:hypothetical protein
VLNKLLSADAAFIDPDLASTEPEYVYRFIDSNTQPSADVVLNKMFEITENMAIVLPPLLKCGSLQISRNVKSSI